MFIYKIVNQTNNKIYIGKTTQKVEIRFAQHKSLLNKNKHPNRFLQASWNKYGESSFKFEVLDQCVFYSGMNNLEVFWIKFLKSNNCNFGYNLSTGGDGNYGFSHSAEAKIKIGQASKLRGGGKVGGHKLKGLVRDRSIVEKIRKANTGKKKSEGYKKELSKRMMGKSIHNTPVVDSLGNKFNSVKMAAEFYNVKPDSISAVLTKRRKTIKKVTFFYLEKGGG